MHNYLKVEGNESLVRDMSTHAIINTNSMEYENHIKKRNMMSQQQDLLTQNTADINNIKQDLLEIKELLLLVLQQN